MKTSKLNSERDLQVLQELVSIPSFVGSDSRLLEVLADRLKLLNYEVTIETSNPSNWLNDIQGSPPLLTEYDQPKYLIAYPPKNRDSGLLLFAHYDTEKPNENVIKLAFTVYEEDAKFFGCGIADDKAGIAAILLAIEKLCFVPQQKLPAIVFAQAKHGGCYGMSQAIQSLKNRTAAIYCHPAESNQGFSQIKVASRGIATFELEFLGSLPTPSEENTPASADPRNGISALSLGWKFISEVENWNDQNIVWLVSEVSTVGRDYQVPQSCKIKISIWFKELDLIEIKNVLHKRFLNFNENWKVSINSLPEMVGMRANPASTKDENFVEKVRSTIRKHTGELPTEYDWHAASDIRFPLLHLGIPSVGFGCLAGGFYGGEEWIDKQSFEQFVEIVFDLARNY